MPMRHPPLYSRPRPRCLIVAAIAAYGVYRLFVDDRDDSPPSSQPRASWSERQHQQHLDASNYERQYQRKVDASYGCQHQLNVDAPNRPQDYRPVEDHASLRARAKQEATLMTQCYQQSHEAYERRDHVRAKTLSDEAKRHALEIDNLNAKASAIIFQRKLLYASLINQLEGALRKQSKLLAKLVCIVSVKEAVAYSEMALAEARLRGCSKIRLIVGQGNHPEGGISRLKPAIQDAMQSHGVHAEVDPKNPGALLVTIT